MSPRTAAEQPPRECEVVVVGGGITGTATAYYLSAAGTPVVVLEEHDLNTFASGRNAGSLHGQLPFEPYTTRGPQWAQSFLPALRFLADSLALWSDLGTELGGDLEVSTRGGVLVADTDEQAEAVARKVAFENAAGFPSELVTGHDLRRLAPYLAPGTVAVEFSPTEGKANTLLAAPAFARAALRQGAQIYTGTRTHTVRPTSDGFVVGTSRGEIRCSRVVLASGGRLADLAGPLGLVAPVTDEPIQVHATEPVTPIISHLVYYAGGRLTLKQARTGTLLIGGGWPATVDPETGHPTVSAASMRGNLQIAQRVAPWIGSVNVIRAWAGVGNATPDLLPIIAETPDAPGAFVGMFPHMGFTAGPLMGRTLAALASGKDPGRNLTPFAADRFGPTTGPKTDSTTTTTD